MLDRLYLHNFKTFQNFELQANSQHSSLIIGKNGAGKSSIARALQVLQSIGRGTNRVGELVSPRDFFSGPTGQPMRFELETRLQGNLYRYVLVLELPEKFKELRVAEELLEVDGTPVYWREQAQVILKRTDQPGVNAPRFMVDWHIVALPLIQVQSETDPVHIFKNWLAQMIVVSPIPQLMQGESTGESLWPARFAENVVDWLAGLLGQYPAAYTTVYSYLKEIMPDLKDFRYESLGKESKRLVVKFGNDSGQLSLNFDELSEGEKCFFLCAVIVAANQEYGPLLCFWDEPDNFLSVSEVGHFVIHLRRAFERQGQIFMTSHNEEAIQKFSNENTWLLARDSHLEPSTIRLLDDLKLDQGLIKAMIRGEL